MSERVGENQFSSSIRILNNLFNTFRTMCNGWNSISKMSTHGIPDMKYPEKVEVGRIEFLPGWNELCCTMGTVCVCKV